VTEPQTLLPHAVSYTGRITAIVDFSLRIVEIDHQHLAFLTAVSDCDWFGLRVGCVLDMFDVHAMVTAERPGDSVTFVACAGSSLRVRCFTATPSTEHAGNDSKLLRLVQDHHLNPLQVVWFWRAYELLDSSLDIASMPTKRLQQILGTLLETVTPNAVARPDVYNQFLNHDVMCAIRDDLSSARIVDVAFLKSVIQQSVDDSSSNQPLSTRKGPWLMTVNVDEAFKSTAGLFIVGKLACLDNGDVVLSDSTGAIPLVIDGPFSGGFDDFFVLKRVVLVIEHIPISETDAIQHAAWLRTSIGEMKRIPSSGLF
jgi:hypothetical protein